MINNEKKLKRLIRESVRLVMEEPDRSKGRNYETDEDMMDLYGLQSDGGGGVAGVKKSKAKGFLDFFGLGDDEEDEETQARKARISQGELKKKGAISSFFNGEDGYDESNDNYYVKEESEKFCLGANGFGSLNFQTMIEMFENLLDVVTDARSEYGNLKNFTISPYSIEVSSKIFKKINNTLVICLDVANEYNLWNEILSPEVWQTERSRNWKWLSLPFIASMFTSGIGPWVLSITGPIAGYKIGAQSQIRNYNNPFEFIYERFGKYNSSEGWWGWWNWLLDILNLEKVKDVSNKKMMNHFTIDSLIQTKDKFKNNLNKLEDIYAYKRATGEEWTEEIDDNGEVTKNYVSGSGYDQDVKHILYNLQQLKLLKNEIAYQKENPDIEEKILRKQIDWGSEKGQKILNDMGNKEHSDIINTGWQNKQNIVKQMSKEINWWRSHNEDMWSYLKRKFSSEEYSGYGYNLENLINNKAITHVPDTLSTHLDVEWALDDIEKDLKKIKKQKNKN